MKVSIIPFESKYSEHFYSLNYDWLDEYFYVEPWIIIYCKKSLINQTLAIVVPAF